MEVFITNFIFGVFIGLVVLMITNNFFLGNDNQIEEDEWDE